MLKPFALAAFLIALTGTASWGQSAKTTSAPAQTSKGEAAQAPATKGKPSPAAKLSADIDRGSTGTSGETAPPIIDGTKTIPSKEETGGDPKPKS